MRVPEDKIEEIRTAADIVEIVSGFVRLKKAGRNFVGLCPFHKEKTPSFNVNPEKSIFKCFGCGRGGNAFTFLMAMEGISFVDAVRELAERYNIPLALEGGPQRHSAEEIGALYEANKVAARFFYDTLRGDGGAAGREYLKKRHWKDETLHNFGVGFAPEGWNNLLDHALKAGIGAEVLEKTGLIVRKEGGRSYDRFRNRLIFPIISVTKKVIGFGGRVLGKEKEAKYLNSPETPIYNKSKVLYGLSSAANSIRQENSVVLVEGYADVLSLYQAGISNVVSTSGTALTPDQVHILSRYTRNFFFLYDADSAGLKAMLRGLDIILEHDCDARIVQLPAGEDPDSFVKKHNADMLKERLREAISFVDYVSDRYMEEGNFETPEGRTQAVRRIVGMIAGMDDKIRREFYIHHIAEKYKIYESVLYHELESLLRMRRKDRPPAYFEDEDTVVKPPSGEVPLEVPRPEKVFMQQLLASSPEIQSGVLHHIRIEYFTHEAVRKLLYLLLEQKEHEGEIDVQSLWNSVQEDINLHSLLADLQLQKNTVSERWSDIQTVREVDAMQALLDAWKKILDERLLVRRRLIQQKMREQSSDTDLAIMLARSLQDVHALEQTLAEAKTFEDLPETDEDEEA